MKVRALSFGDYGAEIAGGLVPIVFERKGLGDLFGTMTGGYKRFKKEMMRAKEANTPLVLLIEGTMREVGGGYEHSRFSGDSMLRKLAMLRVKYDLEYHFCESRADMARLIVDWFEAVDRNYKKCGKRGEK